MPATSRSFDWRQKREVSARGRDWGEECPDGWKTGVEPQLQAGSRSLSLLDPHFPFDSVPELYLDREIDRITPPSALDFYRDYIARHRPVVITDALEGWPAMRKWKMKSYLRAKLHNTSVTIDRVPVTRGRGFGDSVVPPGYFVTPHEEQMKFGTFLDWLESKDKPIEEGVLYCQHQNSSLTEEFQSLTADVPELAWATNAFNAEPDAVNLWFGEDRSVSTLHHDPYENIYAVVTGTKRFLLYPPSDYHWLDKRDYPKAQWKYDADASSVAAASSSSATASSSSSSDPLSRFTLLPSPEGTRTAWFDLEPQDPEDPLPPPEKLNLRLAEQAEVKELPPPGPYPPYSTHPPMPAAARSAYTTPIWVDLQAGEVLYLPALWFHRVAQRGDAEEKTIAVNFWSVARTAGWKDSLCSSSDPRIPDIFVSTVAVPGTICRMTRSTRRFASRSKCRIRHEMRSGRRQTSSSSSKSSLQHVPITKL